MRRVVRHVQRPVAAGAAAGGVAVVGLPTGEVTTTTVRQPDVPDGPRRPQRGRHRTFCDRPHQQHAAHNPQGTAGDDPIDERVDDGPIAPGHAASPIAPPVPPQQVAVELFAASDFFDPRDLLQVKYEMLRRVRVDGYTVIRSAASFGFSRPSFYQAQEAYAAGGLAALVPKKRGPRGAHKLSAQVVAVLQKTLAQQPQMKASDSAEQRLVQADRQCATAYFWFSAEESPAYYERLERPLRPPAPPSA